MIEDAYPLHWPIETPRTRPGNRRRAAFGMSRTGTYPDGGRFRGSRESLSVAQALDRLLSEFRAFGRSRVNPDRVVISSNLELRQDGLPRSGQKQPEDPGVAVYFELDKERRCIPSDKWDRVADNIAGIAAAIGALRGLERWVNDANVRAAFKGFVALPDPNRVDWRSILALRNGDATPEAVHAAYRRLARDRHPDAGGSDAMMADLNRARDQALKEIGSR